MVFSYNLHIYNSGNNLDFFFYYYYGYYLGEIKIFLK